MPHRVDSRNASDENRHRLDTGTSHVACVNGSVTTENQARPPTVRQVYALAAALCERFGEPFPDRRDDASELIERVRREIGHPEPRLDERPRHARPPRRNDTTT